MALLLAMTIFASVRMMLAGIPESVGVLVFGLGLIVAAVVIRKVMSKSVASDADKKTGKKAEV